MSDGGINTAWNVEGYLLLLAPILTAVLAINRGNLLRRINFHTINASFYTASMLVFSVTTDAIDDIINFTLVDGDQQLLARSAVFLVFMSAGIVVLSYQLGEDTVDALYHLFMAFSASGTWLLAAKSTDHAFFWGYQAISTTVLLFIHLFMESRNTQCRNPAYGNSLMIAFSLYVFCFYLMTWLGPWFLDAISLLAQQIVLTVADILTIVYILLGVLHFGGEARLTQHTKTTPGFTDNQSPQFVQQYADIVHTH